MMTNFNGLLYVYSMIIVIENNKNFHFYLFLMTKSSNIRNILLISLFVKRTREDNFLIKVSSLA